MEIRTSFRPLLLAFGLILALTAPALVQAQFSSGLLSNRDAGRFGLERAWNTQVELDRARGRVGYMTLHVSATKAVSIFQVDQGRRRWRYTDRQLSPFRKPYGIEGAKRAADEKVEDLKAIGRGGEPKLTTYVVPESTLYVTTNLGILTAIDAETGETKWTARVGNSSYPTLAPGANDNFVATINGSTLYVFEAESGKLAWQRRTAGVPGAGPNLSDGYVYVPTIRGAMESYWIDDYARPPWIYQPGGRALIQPTIGSQTVAWATDRGHVFVANALKNGIKFRLETGDTIVAPATAKGKYLYVGSMDGYVYCMAEISGAILWEHSTGEPIAHRPMVVGDAVYVVTQTGSLFKLDSKTSEEQWVTRNVQRILSISEGRLYCLNRLGQLVMIDTNSGGLIGGLKHLPWDLTLSNVASDRIFVANGTGTIQCIKEIGREFPYVHRVVEEEAAKPQEIEQGAPLNNGQNNNNGLNNGGPNNGANPPNPFNNGGGAPNPFDNGGGAPNPFDNGGGAAPNPFDNGGGAAPDPFGGGGGDAPDPFGGGGGDAPDPFGGGGGGDAPDPFGGGGGGDAPDPFGGGGGDAPDPFGGN